MSRHTRHFAMYETSGLRERAEAAIETLLALLDQIEGDADVEGDDADLEDEIDHCAEWRGR